MKNEKLTARKNYLPLGIEKESFRTDLPKLKVGEEIKVVFSRTNKFDKKEKAKKKLSSSSSLIGKIISLKNPQRISYTFTLLTWSNKMKFIIKFLYHSKSILKIEKLTKMKNKVRGKKMLARRAKLYYLTQ